MNEFILCVTHIIIIVDCRYYIELIFTKFDLILSLALLARYLAPENYII